MNWLLHWKNWVRKLPVPDLYDFLLYSAASKEYQSSRMMPSKIASFGYNRLIDLMQWLRNPIKRELKKYDKFDNITSIRHIAEGAKPFLSLGNRAGEGWFLTGEMVELIEHGIENIVCTQPFACLPNHIVGQRHGAYATRCIPALQYSAYRL